MKISIADMRDHVVTFVRKEALAVDQAEHRLVQRFVAYVEGKQGEADAVAYLKNLGYVVTAPTQTIPPTPPATVA